MYGSSPVSLYGCGAASPIVASDGYFKKKQNEYVKSKVEVTQILVTTVTNDWTLENIQQRDIMVVNDIKNLLKQWDEDYKNYNAEKPEEKEGPSEEFLKQLEEYKKKGWIS